MSEVSAGRAPASAQPARAWQRMLSGRRLDLLDPQTSDIAIEDIAHGLARVARWNGQTLGACSFSVAQHALFVEEIACAIEGVRADSWPRQWRLAALLHDAPEYVIGDLISPFKTAIGLDYKAFELRLLAAIHLAFGLPAVLPSAVTAAIKRADTIAAYYEATRLAGFATDEASHFFGAPPSLPDDLGRRLQGLTAAPAEASQKAFLARFKRLQSDPTCSG